MCKLLFVVLASGSLFDSLLKLCIIPSLLIPFFLLLKTFCATGTMGLWGNLTTGEILEQIVHADRILAQEWRERCENENWHANIRGNNIQDKLKLELVRNVVFMGQGEPLDNYTNVVEACRALIDCKRWNLAHGKVTVSTVGIISKIRKLTQELPEVSLALSLHAPNQAMRSAIVPTAKHYPIDDLIDALDGHMKAYLEKRTPPRTTVPGGLRVAESSRRRAMIEYVMLEGDTSSLECAHELGKLCENRTLLVNLIPYNPTDVRDKLRCPSEQQMNEFRRIVSSYGTACTIRRTMGADIDSACGQLVTLKQQKDQKEKAVVRDIEDIASKDKSKSTQVSQPKQLRKSLSKEAEESGETTTSETDLDRWVRALAVATTLAASCFVVSSYMFLKQRRR